MRDRDHDPPAPAADLTATRAARGEILTAVSDGIVALFKEFYGKGPTRAKTYYEDDLVVCLLRGGFTRVEETLRDAGRGHEVILQRMAFQDVMRDRFEAVIQQATGRRVIGFMSGNQQDPDMLCEIFVLAPSDLIDEDLPAEPSTALTPIPSARRSTSPRRSTPRRRLGVPGARGGRLLPSEPRERAAAPPGGEAAHHRVRVVALHREVGRAVRAGRARACRRRDCRRTRRRSRGRSPARASGSPRSPGRSRGRARAGSCGTSRARSPAEGSSLRALRGDHRADDVDPVATARRSRRRRGRSRDCAARRARGACTPRCPRRGAGPGGGRRGRRARTPRRRTGSPAPSASRIAGMAASTLRGSCHQCGSWLPMRARA